MIGKGDKDGEGKSLFESSSDISEGTSQEASHKTENISTDTQNSHSNGETKQESKHDTTPSNKDNTIISQNEEGLKVQKYILILNFYICLLLKVQKSAKILNII